ncbi:hypothetical protein H4R33_002151 [Dimargaris cristalligena]|nr:hypothetical protein H4R33_002151 [Dimargaris cristalligena]
MSTARIMVDVAPATKPAAHKSFKSGDASPIGRPQYNYFANVQVPTPDLTLDFTTWVPSETAEEIDSKATNSDSASTSTSTPIPTITQAPVPVLTPTTTTVQLTGRVKWVNPRSQTIAPVEEWLGALTECIHAI